MDTKKHLVLIRNKKSGIFEDRTTSVVFCKKQANCFNTKFKTSDAVYHMKKFDIKYFDSPKVMDTEGFDIIVQSELKTDIKEIIRFGKFLKIFCDNGFTKYYNDSEIEFTKQCLDIPRVKDTFDYLSTLSKYHKIKKTDEDDNNNEDEANNGSFLAKQYERMGHIHPKSFLTTYLDKRAIETTPNTKTIIYPFGFNISQKQAVEYALSNSGSIIEGPPGTGKTQTILNIICNLIINDKSMAIVSSNNSATKNVQDKLKKNGLDFICAFLGNSKNKDKFFDNIQNKPELNEWSLSDTEHEELLLDIENKHENLNTLLKTQNEVAQLNQSLRAYQTEYKYFCDYYNPDNKIELSELTLFHKEITNYSSFLAEFNLLIAQNNLNSIITKIKLFIKYRIIRFKLLAKNTQAILDTVKDNFYKSKLNEISYQILERDKYLSENKYQELQAEYTLNCMKYFKSYIAKRYMESKHIAFTQKGFKSNFKDFIFNYPVILSTTHSLRSCKPTDYLFDYIIIDEASQVDLVTGALAISCGKNVTIVGDLKQLPQIVSNENRKTFERIFQGSFIPDEYNYINNSLLSSISNIYKKNIARTLLREHYRCHPKIIGFCNEKFYDNQLIIMTEGSHEDNALSIIKSTEGNHARTLDGHKYNQREIEIIFKEVLPNNQLCPDGMDIGIVSPYRKQTDKIQERLGEDSNIEADTVHKYQGREKDIMIMTTVANKPNRFINDANLINVAVSRAIEKFIIITANNTFEQHGTNIGDLLRYIKYHSRDEDIVESNVISVFDLLYTEYSDKLKELLPTLTKVSKYQSENIMNHIIEDVFSKPEYSCFKHILHTPLKSIAKNSSLLSDEETKYLNHRCTHVDFLIYNKLDKKPVLVVEVDGTTYHENKKEQLVRDKLKNSILKKSGIPIIRLKTNEINIEETFVSKLDEVKEI